MRAHAALTDAAAFKPDVEVVATVGQAGKQARETVGIELQVEAPECCGKFIAAGLGKHILPCLDFKHLRHVVVEHGEACRHARLERKPLQHAFTEGVDGLDFQPARRFDGTREQPARQLRLAPVG